MPALCIEGDGYEFDGALITVSSVPARPVTTRTLLLSAHVCTIFRGINVYVIASTVEPIHKDTICGPSYIYRDVYKSSPKMRTPPLIRTLEAVPRVSRIEGFHCIYM